MVAPLELYEALGLPLTRPRGTASTDYRNVLASLAAVAGDEEIGAHASWFDYGVDFDGKTEAEVAVHVRLLTDSGVITVDYEFSFDGAPDARFMPWSRVDALNVVATLAGALSIVENAWLETSLGRIEFAGARKRETLGAIVDLVRLRLV